MQKQASDILQVFRECLPSPLVNELEMGGRAELRESYGDGMDCWHSCLGFCFFLFGFSLSSVPCLLCFCFCTSCHSFRCDVYWDQKSFHVHMQILHRRYTLLSFLRLFPNLSARVQKLITPIVSASVRVIRSTGKVTNSNATTM